MTLTKWENAAPGLADGSKRAPAVKDTEFVKSSARVFQSLRLRLGEVGMDETN